MHIFYSSAYSNTGLFYKGGWECMKVGESKCAYLSIKYGKQKCAGDVIEMNSNKIQQIEDEMTYK